MEKTVLKLSKNISIIILSTVMLLFSLVNNYNQINNSISFLFVLTKCGIFMAVPLVVYIIEKHNDEFKKVAGIYTGYAMINIIIVIISSVSINGGVFPQLWRISFDFINLVILLTSLFVFVEKESMVQYIRILYHQS